VDCCSPFEEKSAALKRLASAVRTGLPTRAEVARVGTGFRPWPPSFFTSTVDCCALGERGAEGP
jgi:hypothetical protein